MARQMMTGRSVWRGDELARAGDWIFWLDATHKREIADALAHVHRAPLFGFGRDDFPLSATTDLLAQVNTELEDGRGAVRLRGLDVEHYTDDELRQIFWGLGQHLGRPLYQNMSGEIMGEVRDETRDEKPTFIASASGQVQSSRARARSTGPLRFHTDRCDIIALMCVRNGIEGGVSKLASIPTIHNEMLRRRPDLVELLFQDFYRCRPKDEDGVFDQPWFILPVWGERDGKITSQYSRTYVEQAQEFPEVPRLTEAQNAALDLLAEVAEETCLHSPFERGDIQLLNNHVVYHGRTAYADDVAAGRARLLVRLWLATPNSRALPAGFETFWGDIAPGSLRGGVPQRDGRRTPPPATLRRVA
ncbi:MAG TPA: TauD/TfdA family dioxygenase [Acetobacteraceae bacterium]|nr:TauD/TfdA family dioxygenase [Acetobacteraceae bacterium]